MGYQYSFQDGVLYGVDDVNGIVSNFTSAGVSTYMDLNGIAAALTNAGVTNKKESCMVVASGSDCKIMPGIVFFGDGSRVTVDSDGVVLPKKKYIYMKKDTSSDTGYPVSSETPPGNGDIPLAEYTEGTIKDVRECAKSKIAGFGTNLYAMLDYQKNNVEVKHETSSSLQTYQIDTITLANYETYQCVMVFDNNGKYIAYGKMKTADSAADYVYRYSDNNFLMQQGGNQSSFMVYGIDNYGKVYISFEQTAAGIGVFMTTENNLPISTMNLSMKLRFA